MFRINAAQYRKEHKLRPDEPVPAIGLTGGIQTVLHEFEQEEDECCFVRSAAQLYLQEITPEDYFERLINHVEVDGTRHAFDNAQSIKMDQLLLVDIVGGAVKSLMLNRSFARLDATEADKLKGLCLLTYQTALPADLQRKANLAGTPLATLPPRWLELLAVIAYARRHVAVLQHLVASYPSPSARSTFDLLTRDIISSRQNTTFPLQTPLLQHSPLTPKSKLVEIDLWTAILASPFRWIHCPMKPGEAGLHGGLLSLLDFGAKPYHARLRDTLSVAALCGALSAHGINPDMPTLSRLLSLRDGTDPRFKTPGGDGVVPCSVAAAETFLSSFPLPKVLQKGDSATLMFPVTQWPVKKKGKEDGDRLVVMRMLLERGCDPRAEFDRRFWLYQRTEGASVLRLAEERRDGEMVKLLREFGGVTDDEGTATGTATDGKKRKRTQAEFVPPLRWRRVPRGLRDTGIGSEPDGMDFFG